MAHEITSSDNLVLVRERAWHGLGLIIPEAVTPTAALGLIGADWGVKQLPLFARDEQGNAIEIPDQLLNVRADNNAPLGIVSDHYQVFSNAQVAEFCESLVEVGEGEQTPVRVETAGTIRGGKKCWFLLRGQEFAINDKDEVVPYVLVANGHDGLTSLTVTPTTIRVVCSNTLHMVIPQVEGAGVSSAAITINHIGNLQGRVASAREALRQYDYALRNTQSRMEVLAKKEIKRQEMIDFFTARYEADFESVLRENANPKVEERRKNRAGKMFDQFVDRFDEERELTGMTWWGAFNAYTGVLQHDRATRGKDDVNRLERKVGMNLLGLNVDRAHAAFELALNMAS